jgi:dTDP-4-dehydrorhamnose 3,5-epimerase
LRFTALEPDGVWLVQLEPVEDERGFFARAWDPDEFLANGLDPSLVQVSLSYSERRGTLRGLHYQVAPFEEAKLVRCTAGRAFDVAVDVRDGSATRGGWAGVELSAENRLALYVPPGFAHGVQTLVDGTEILYQISARYSPEHSRGIRWNDPEVGVQWPIRDPILSPRDREHPILAEMSRVSGPVNRGTARWRAPFGSDAEP